MPSQKRYANIYQPRPNGPWFARITVPADVRAITGQKFFQKTTGHTVAAKAHAAAAPMLAAWRAEIDAARKGLPKPVEAEIERLATQYRKLRGTDAGADLIVRDVLAFLRDRSGMTPASQREAMIDARGDIAAAHPHAAEDIGRIVGTRNIFLVNFETWKKATRLKGKTLAQAISHCEKFAAAVSEPIETLTGRHVQAWIEKTIAGGMNPKTINSYLASIRNYWTWMQSHEMVPETAKPFWGRTVTDRRTELEIAQGDRKRFTPEQVVALWKACDDDPPLQHLIILAAYTGARRESLAALKVSDIHLSDKYIHFEDKSKAGIRDVPIHSDIFELMGSLIKNADKQGYLIHEGLVNKYGSRGDALGKRFTRLKRLHGFGPLHTYHSIRHTIAYLFEKSECPEGIAADIIGHKKPGMTFGTYSGISDLEQKRYWMEKAISYPTGQKDWGIYAQLRTPLL